MSTPISGAPIAPPAPKASNQALTALILGIVGIFCCQLMGPIAWYLGNQEMKAIREDRSSSAGEGFAKAGMILGIIGTILFVFSIVWIFFMGGMAILSSLSANH